MTVVHTSDNAADFQSHEVVIESAFKVLNILVWELSVSIKDFNSDIELFAAGTFGVITPCQYTGLVDLLLG